MDITKRTKRLKKYSYRH